MLAAVGGKKKTGGFPLFQWIGEFIDLLSMLGVSLEIERVFRILYFLNKENPFFYRNCFLFLKTSKLVRFKNRSPAGIIYLLNRVIIKSEHAVKNGYHSKVTYEYVVILGVGCLV